MIASSPATRQRYGWRGEEAHQHHHSSDFETKTHKSTDLILTAAAQLRCDVGHTRPVISQSPTFTPCAFSMLLAYWPKP